MGKRASRMRLRGWFDIVCRVVLAGVFICAGIGKILKPGEFADAVAAFKILPIALVNIFAIVLPWVELLSGLALLHRASSRHGALMMIGLNLMFMVAVASAMTRGLDIECGCFTLSHAHSKVGWGLLARDGGLLLLCLPIMLCRYHSSAYKSKGTP